MPIPVTCSECQYHFLVGDEFAGRPGRCPECSAVIHVPGPDSDLPHPGAHPDPFPERTPRAADSFDDFPSRVRRRREDVRERDRYEDDLRDDFDDRRGGPRGSSFDPHARSAAWNRVYKGLGYVQIAVILYFFGQSLQMGFMLIRGVDRMNGNGLPDSGEIAVGIGGLVVMMAAGVFWLIGRFGGTRVPYVPARGWAKVSFFLSLSGVACMVGFFCMFVSALVMVGQQGPNPGAVLILLLAVMVMLFAGLLLVGAEVSALVSLAKIGDGLQAPGAASWARQTMVLLFILLGLMMAGFCGLTIYSAEQQKQKQAGAGNPPAVQQNGAAPQGKNKDKDKDAAPAKANAAPAGANGQQQQQQQNPFGDDQLDDKTQFIVQTVMIGMILLYLLHFSIGLQRGRRAIRDEMNRLTGVEEERVDRHDPY